MYNPSDAMVAALVGTYFVGILLLSVIYAIGLWRIFTKAGHAGWKAFIPFYNIYIMQTITFGQDKGIWFLLIFLPPVTGIYMIYLHYNFARAYGLSVGASIAYIFFFELMNFYLGFSEDVSYQGPQNFFVN